MSSPALRLVSSRPDAAPPARGGPSDAADALARAGGIGRERLLFLERGLSGQDTTLAETLRASGEIDDAAIARAEAALAGAGQLDPGEAAPDARLIDAYGAGRALRDRVLPWRRIGATTVVAVTRAADFTRHEARLRHLFGSIQMAIVAEDALVGALLRQRRHALARAAETRVNATESSRTIWSGRRAWAAAVCTLVLAALAVAQPLAVLAIATGWAVFTLALTFALRLAAGVVRLCLRQPRAEAGDAPPDGGLPRVSILVPLFREREIAARLMARLERIDYPRALLDIVLIAEKNDTITRAALDEIGLPPWMQLVIVPPGALQTKPRAMNYALDFARGSIIGVYDAEDAPDPGQIHHVVRRFAALPPDVACLQGVLDFYNARDNWLSRCFAIDYATWFRVLLPGLSRMRLVVPLGGTTLFFRRDVLESLGGWDAHNVTEDADLGLRLARRGFRTELIDTVTAEEANCRVWPWVRQRSRWLKGYAVTYAVHMRAPGVLLSDLGLWRFLGVQVLFLGTLSQFVLAPVLWSFWMVPLGLGHPLEALMPRGAMMAIAGLFLVSELLNIALGASAVSGRRHRWLIGWVPTMHLYWPLGAVASYKALWELVAKPFYWDKTAHGLDGSGGDAPVAPMPEAGRGGGRPKGGTGPSAAGPGATGLGATGSGGAR